MSSRSPRELVLYSCTGLLVLVLVVVGLPAAKVAAFASLLSPYD